jgi:hypothetical protein
MPRPKSRILVLLTAAGCLSIASQAIAQLPFTVTGVDGGGYAKARATCTGTPQVRKAAHSMNPTYDLNVDVSCNNVGTPGSATGSAQSKSSNTGIGGTEIQLSTIYNTKATAFQAYGEGNFKLEGESDSYWEVQNTSNAAITIAFKWSVTESTGGSNPGGFAEADASIEITDEAGNPLKGLGQPGSGTLLVCVPPGFKFFISLYAYSKSKATSISPTIGANANANASTIVNLSVSNQIIGGCDSVVVEDPPPPPPPCGSSGLKASREAGCTS